MAEFKLEMKNIAKSFPGVKALDNVQLSVRPGTVHALMGENGAGKSTLFSIMTEDIKGTFRINTDEIVKKIGNWKNESDQIKSAKIAIKLRNEYIRGNYRPQAYGD